MSEQHEMPITRLLKKIISFEKIQRWFFPNDEVIFVKKMILKSTKLCSLFNYARTAISLLLI